MSIDTFALALYATPLVAIWLVYVVKRRDKHHRNIETLKENVDAGLTEPASLHPAIDAVKCIGCASCVAACPEMPKHQVLGIVRNKAVLVSPTDCIGHGACLSACPVDAISLVFGTERRGVDIPHVGPTFETNVPGIYIAGELGGMGLIRNAIEQGRQAMRSIQERCRKGRGADLDVVIVGAGPTGIAASLAAKEAGLTYLTLEQDSLGGTVANFPRRKLVMTQPAMLPLVGRVKFTETEKETLIEFWQKVEREHALDIEYGVFVEAVRANGSGFEVTANGKTYAARTVLLAIGRRGTPRKLGVPGAEL
jgi:thioredoxin reductase (NADPH)